MLLSTILDVWYEKALGIGKSKFWILFPGFIFLIVIAINGIGILPEAPYQRLSENPFITRTEIHFNNYWQANPLLPIIAHYLHLTSPNAFNILCFVIFTGAVFLFAVLSRQRLGGLPSLIFSMLFITSPLTTTSLSWLGTPDGLTAFFTIPFLFTQSGSLLFFLSVLGVINHPTFAIAVIEVLVLRWVARDGISFKHVFLTAVGLIIGYGLVKLFLSANQIEMVTRTDFMLLREPIDWLKMNAQNLPMTLSSLFNIHWLILFLCMTLFFKKNKLFYIMVAVILLVNYGITFFTLDTTRIFSLLSWAVLFECMLYSIKLARTDEEDGRKVEVQFLQALMVIGAASFITPRYYSWAGEIHTTPFYEFWRKLLR